MWVWMKPGSRTAPAASITASCGPSMAASIAAMRPSHTETSPRTTSKRSFMVRTTALRISVDTLFLQRAFPFHADGGDVRLGQLAMLHGNQLGEDADRDLLRRDRA